LPALHTQLFGLEQHSATVRDLLLRTPERLVTLTGTGGCGKTQLALLVATSLIDAFPNDVWLLDLAPVQAAELVPQTVMSTLGVREQPNEAPLQTLLGWIGGHSLMLVLDNCEHLMPAHSTPRHFSTRAPTCACLQRAANRCAFRANASGACHRWASPSRGCCYVPSRSRSFLRPNCSSSALK
jgi:hypothetical protein